MLMANKDKIHIMISNWRSVLLSVRIKPAKVESKAPQPIIIDPPSPEAAPASIGLTASIPAVAFGIQMPLPKPTKAIKPKNVLAVLKPKKLNNKDNDKPKIKMPNPITIMLSMPINVLYFPAKIVPSKKPRAGTAK